MRAQKPPRTPSSARDGDAVDAARTPAARAAERLADELTGTPSLGAEDREEAFESARKKFAMYGKQNAHVSHYSPDQQQAMLERNRQRTLKRQGSGGAGGGVAKAVPLARRIVDWDDGDADTPTAIALQNTLLLQENGELAAQLDEIEYHLDGILARPDGGTGESQDAAYAMAASVVALNKLLLLEQVQTVLKVASQSQQLHARLRDVLLLLVTIDHRMLRLSIAVLAFAMTTSAVADEVFNEEVIDGVVACLETESKRLGKDAEPVTKQHSGEQTSTAETSRESKTPLKKAFLKRKKSGVLSRVASSVDDPEPGGGAGDKDQKADLARSNALRDEQFRANLRVILSGHDVFVVDGGIQLSIADLLCMILHNILQIGGASGGEASETLFTQSGQPASRRFHQRQDLAGTTFATIMARKQQLLRNRGLDLLLIVLGKRFDQLENDLSADLLQASVSLDLASAFQRVRTMLRVLDQASFLAAEVQLRMSKDEMIFRVTLKLVEALSQLAWSHKSKRKWQSDPSFMQLIVDVLMAALRVLINLSHQNEDANTHIAKLEGTKILFLAFCKLWGTVEVEHETRKATIKGCGDATTSPSFAHGTEEKVVYDALLLILSAITNCVEYSAENRALLSKLDISSTTLEGLGAFRSSSVCNLLVSFFVSKVQSYLHLIEMSESQSEMECESWVPEDVILGGCTSLLLGCLMKDSSYNSAVVLGALPDGSPRLLLRALSAFVALHSQIGALTPEVGKSVLEVEKLLKSFMSDGDELMPSPASDKRSPGKNFLGSTLSSSTTTSPRRSPPGISREVNKDSMETEISFQLKVTPGKAQRVFELEEEKHGDGGQVHDAESQVSQASHQAVRSPPASAFKLQRFRVCSNMDDSDDLASDIDPSPAKKKRRAVQTPLTQSRSVGKSKVVVNATVTFTPVRRVSDSAAAHENPASQGGKSSTQRRLKRTRQLVSDLEAEFMKIGSRVSSEINAAAMTSTEDGGGSDFVDFSHDLYSSQDSKDVKTTSTPAKPVKATRPAQSLKTPKQAKASAKPAEAPLSSHKRKLKATPAKSSKSKVAESTSDDGVFDFPG